MAIVGQDYFKQVYLASFLKNEAKASNLDVEDFEILLERCGRYLKYAEFTEINTSKYYTVPYDILLSKLYNLQHLNLKDSKLRYSSGPILAHYISNAPHLQSLNLRNCM
jgi:hypothetical protein